MTYHVHNAGCFIRLNRVSYPGYVVYIISGLTNSSQRNSRLFARERSTVRIGLKLARGSLYIVRFIIYSTCHPPTSSHRPEISIKGRKLL